MAELKIATARNVSSKPPTMSAPKRLDSDWLLVRTDIKRERGDAQIRTGESGFCRALPYHLATSPAPWSGWRVSNPRVDLGKVTGYHYITPAGVKRAISVSQNRRPGPLASPKHPLRTSRTSTTFLVMRKGGTKVPCSTCSA